MAIRNEIDPGLWASVQKNYDSENYTGSILDAVMTLTDTIRNKTGLEGDGGALVGQAFGGDNPMIKLNKLQTDSEKDIQRGIQDILRGIYTAIRNPRSHDAMKDDKETADAIIIFVNYLLKLIDSSQLRFEESAFLKRVFDPYYVNTSEYSKLLVKEIPKRQRANIAIRVFLDRNEDDHLALGLFIKELLPELTDADLSRVCSVVSEELKMNTSQDDILNIIRIFPGKYWGLIDRAVRLRIEEILFEDFSNGRYNDKTHQCVSRGALATWVSLDYLSRFDNICKWTACAVDMMESDDPATVSYIHRYFWSKICTVNRNSIYYSLKAYFHKGLVSNDPAVIKQLSDEIIWDEDHPWWKVFEEELKQHPEIKYDPDAFPF